MIKVDKRLSDVCNWYAQHTCDAQEVAGALIHATMKKTYENKSGIGGGTH